MKTRTKNIIGVLIGLGLTVALAMAFINIRNEKTQLAETKVSLEKELHTRDSAYNEIINVMYEVESKIEKIKARENLISNMSSGELTMSIKDQMVADMGRIDSLIIETNETVSKLVSKLDNANMNLNSFKKRINQLSKDLKDRQQSIVSLKKDLEEKDVVIADLSADVKSLEYEVSIQEETITTQMNKIVMQEDEMSKAYFAIGTEKALEKDGLVAKEGGFLWFGKTTELQENAAQNKFSEIDIRTTGRLIVDAEEVDLITEHPTNSYEIVKDGDVIRFIEITDPEEFWKISKYLVVAVKS